jgi:DNA-binding response OmpR family regulator
MPAESSTHFQRLLPDWLRAMYLRAQRLERDGWDINMLQLLHDDARTLAQNCELFGATDFGASLVELQQQLQSHVQQQTLPQAAQSLLLLQKMHLIAAKAIKPGTSKPRPPAKTPVAAGKFGDDDGSPILLDAATHAELIAAFPTAQTLAQNSVQNASVLSRGLFDDSEFTPQHSSTARPQRHHIFHFSDGNALMRSFDPLLEMEGHLVSVMLTLDSVLAALAQEAPNLLVVDPSLLSHSETLRNAALARGNHVHPLRLLSFCSIDSPKLQQAVIRAGIDLLIALPAHIEYTLERIRSILSDDNKALRILIVQDDDAQLAHSEEILDEAGLQTLAMPSAFLALAQMESFNPDLILTELHLAECTVVELIRLIRARQQFTATPIIVISDSPDPEYRALALAAGGDDVISRPIDPQQLIALIHARLQRNQQLIRHKALSTSSHETRGGY